MAKATLKKVEAKRIFKFEDNMVVVDTELGLETVELISEITNEMKTKLLSFLQKHNAKSEDDLTTAQRKKFDKLLEEEAHKVVRDDLVELLTEHSVADLIDHYTEMYGEALGQQKYKIFATNLVTEAFQFVNTP